MTAGAVIPPTIIPLRLPVHGKPKQVVDMRTPIEFRSETTNTEIFYTLDGSKPNPFPWVGSDWRTKRYKQPIFLDQGRIIIKALAVDVTKNRESAVVTKTFHVEKYVDSGEDDWMKSASCKNSPARDVEQVDNGDDEVDDDANDEVNDDIKDEDGEVTEEVEAQQPSSVNNEVSINVQDASADDNTANYDVRINDDEIRSRASNSEQSTDDVLAMKHDDDAKSDEFLDHVQHDHDDFRNNRITQITPSDHGYSTDHLSLSSPFRCQNCSCLMLPNPQGNYCSDCGQTNDRSDIAFLLPSGDQLGTCPECRCHVPTNMSHCLICETPFEKSAVLIRHSETKDCRHCHTVNRRGESVCNICSTPLPKISTNFPPKTVSSIYNPALVITTREYVSCESCGRINTREGRYCDWCGKLLSATSELSLECSNCSVENQAFARFCQGCGYPMQPPQNRAITNELRKQMTERSVQATCDCFNSYAQTDTTGFSVDMKTEAIQTTGYYPVANRWKKAVQNMGDSGDSNNHRNDSNRVSQHRIVSPGKGFWRLQVEHITSHIKTMAYNDGKFRAQISNIQLKELTCASVKMKGATLLLLFSFEIDGCDVKDDDVKDNDEDDKNCDADNISMINKFVDELNKSKKSEEEIKNVNKENQPKPPSAKRKGSAVRRIVTNEELLLTAIQNKCGVEEIREILEKGADLEKCVKNGRSALTWAVMTDNVEIIPLLIQQHQQQEDDGCCDQYPSYNETQPPLHTAVMLQDAGHKIVELLLKYGAVPDEKNRKGQTAYDVAAAVNNKYASQLFSKHFGKTILTKLLTKTH